MTSEDATLPVPALVDDDLPELEREGLRYELGGRLGAGGMGEVLLARDLRIGREVARKVLRPGLQDDPGVQGRFVREARVQGQLEHPAVVPVHDLGRDADGSLWFTMKRLRGRTLDQVLSALEAGDPEVTARFTRRKLLTDFATVCLALDFAHARGVVHRDLKPSNVMFGEFGEVHVLDWGIARVLGRDDPSVQVEAPVTPGSTPVETQAGSLIGTPGYMSPEQCNGLPADARSDVFALGAILFELLTLRPLVTGENTLQTLLATTRGPDARARSRAPERDVPPELEALCVEATAADPARRTPSARALAEAVERFLDGDRDLSLRRSMARAHVDRALAALDAARGDPSREQGARSEAMGELSRALALDPQEPVAGAMLSRLLTEPPSEVPPEVHARERQSLRDRAVRSARLVVGLYALWLLLVPVGLWVGVKSYAALGAMALSVLAAAGSGALIAWRRDASAAVSWVILALASAAAVSLTTVFGPLGLVPGVATLNASFFSLSTNLTDRRGAILAVALATVLGPVAVEALGLVPSQYAFDAGRLCIEPRMLALRPGASLALWAAASALTVTVSVLFTARFRDVLAAAERRSLLQAWHLEQLVPASSREALAAAREGEGSRFEALLAQLRRLRAEAPRGG